MFCTNTGDCPILSNLFCTITGDCLILSNLFCTVVGDDPILSVNNTCLLMRLNVFITVVVTLSVILEIRGVGGGEQYEKGLEEI